MQIVRVLLLWLSRKSIIVSRRLELLLPSFNRDGKVWWGPNSKDFWPTMKPFLSQKSTKKSDEPIVLKETNEKLVSEQSKVAERLNTFYINIAENIGINSNVQKDVTHPSVQKIHAHLGLNENFDFTPITDSATK